MTDIILPDYPFEAGDEVAVLISGLGATPVLLSDPASVPFSQPFLHSCYPRNNFHRDMPLLFPDLHIWPHQERQLL